MPCETCQSLFHKRNPTNWLTACGNCNIFPQICHALKLTPRRAYWRHFASKFNLALSRLDTSNSAQLSPLALGKRGAARRATTPVARGLPELILKKSLVAYLDLGGNIERSNTALCRLLIRRNHLFAADEAKMAKTCIPAFLLGTGELF